MFGFESLEVWKFAIAFNSRIYAVLQKFPREETFTLAGQLRRAAISISANIAEGSGSASEKDFSNYLSIAVKSLFEVVSLLAIARENRYIPKEVFDSLYVDAEKLGK